jgi:hypothetical protein
MRRPLARRPVGGVAYSHGTALGERPGTGSNRAKSASATWLVRRLHKLEHSP